MISVPTSSGRAYWYDYDWRLTGVASWYIRSGGEKGGQQTTQEKNKRPEWLLNYRNTNFNMKQDVNIFKSRDLITASLFFMRWVFLSSWWGFFFLGSSHLFGFEFVILFPAALFQMADRTRRPAVAIHVGLHWPRSLWHRHFFFSSEAWPHGKDPPDECRQLVGLLMEERELESKPLRRRTKDQNDY